MRVYAFCRDPSIRELLPAKKTIPKNPPEITAMSRRPLVLLALVISSIVLNACADISAPRSSSCRSGYVDSTGRCAE